MVSGLLEVTDPRSHDPFARHEHRASLGDLVESFVGTSYAETTAALTAVRALVPDELVKARIGRELERRRHPMPAWLTALAHAQVEPDVWLLTHVLGDGDDYLFGVTLPSGHPLSALVYVDHNLGTVVKDAFLVPEPLEDLALKVGTTMDDPDQSLTRTDPATARAVVEAALEDGSRLYPPPTSDSWPMCRPLVEWMLRQLPSGGTAPERKEWSEEETAAIAADFFASRFGAPLDHDDERSLLDSVLWFGTGYGTGDPFRWSPVTVEILLDDWFPRKVVAEPSCLTKLPDVVRAFIRYCHERQGIRVALTVETLAAVDHHEPESRGSSARPGRRVRRRFWPRCSNHRRTTETTSARARSCWRASIARSAVGCSCRTSTPPRWRTSRSSGPESPRTSGRRSVRCSMPVTGAPRSVDPHRLYTSMGLGAPDLLTSERRAGIIAARDRWMDE